MTVANLTVKEGGTFNLFDLEKIKPDYSLLQKYYPEVKEKMHLLALDAIRPEMTNGPWIGGGAALQWYLNKSCKTDIDVWCRTEKQEEKIIQRLTSRGFYETWKSDNAITYRGNIPYENKTHDSSSVKDISDILPDKITIQLIKRTYPQSPKEIIDDFDFTACQLVTDGVTYIAGKNTYKDIKAKKLRLVQYFPKTFLKRYVKYVAYGFTPDPDLINDIFEQHGNNVDMEFNVEGEYDF